MPMSATASTTGSSLVDPHQQTVLRQLVQAGERGDKTARRIAQRARIVLLASEGRSLEDIARQEGISTRTTWVWRADFMRDGVPALTPKRCNPPPAVSINDQQRAALETIHPPPPPFGCGRAARGYATNLLQVGFLTRAKRRCSKHVRSHTYVSTTEKPLVATGQPALGWPFIRGILIGLYWVVSRAVKPYIQPAPRLTTPRFGVYYPRQW